MATLTRITANNAGHTPPGNRRPFSALRDARIGTLADVRAFRIGIDSELQRQPGGKPRAFSDTAATVPPVRQAETVQAR